MIKELINNNKIDVHFQPIISTNNQIFAYEALTRAIDNNNDSISPIQLFEDAKDENLSSLLDNYVRCLAVQKFKEYYKENPELFLFLNFESSLVDEDTNSEFLEAIYKNEIPFKNIVIEIKEDSIKDNLCLEKFVKKYKELGFIIALDDFGTGYSSFDRLALINPNIVKLDRSIIYNIQNNYINLEIVKAIANMCHKIGAVVLAEGVETKEEILTCMRYGINIYQGFYFCYPQENFTKECHQTILDKNNNINIYFRNILEELLYKKNQIIKRSQKITKKTIDVLNSNTINYISQIKSLIKDSKEIEAVYLLDYKQGFQIGNTIMNIDEQKLFFKPSEDGNDHSYKDYYISTKNSKENEFITEKYISKATGNMCNTYCSVVNLNGFKSILCFDILR